jgi:hypothetical protein
MAGTIVADTIQNGAGTSTSMNNAINGSAKAWVNFAGASGTIASSYNVSSVTRNSTGQYYVNFTTAFSDANYSAIMCASGNVSSNPSFGLGATPLFTTTSVFMSTGTGSWGAYADAVTVCCAVFR